MVADPLPVFIDAAKSSHAHKAEENLLICYPLAAKGAVGVRFGHKGAFLQKKSGRRDPTGPTIVA